MRGMQETPGEGVGVRVGNEGKTMPLKTRAFYLPLCIPIPIAIPELCFFLFFTSNRNQSSAGGRKRMRGVGGVRDGPISPSTCSI